MPKNETTTAPTIDFASLSAADLAKLLAEARKAEKAKADQIAALPMFAFFVVMADNSFVQWSGKAADQDSAIEAAKAYALGEKGEGAEVFSVAPRPLPKPRGRKPAATAT